MGKKGLFFILVGCIFMCLTLGLYACGDDKNTGDSGSEETNQSIFSFFENYSIPDSYYVQINIDGVDNINSKELVIPSEYQGKKVTGITDNFLKGFPSLKFEKIIIPDGIIEIGEGAFEECRSLQEISIPDSVETLGKNAFKNCTSLTKVKLSKKIQVIGYNTFENCYRLQEINLHEGLKEIGGYAFAECYNLTKIKLPSTLKVLREQAFANCYKIAELINPTELLISQVFTNVGIKQRLNEEPETSSFTKDSNGYIFYNYNDTNYLINYVGANKNITLPESFNGKNYIINEYAFYYCDLESAIIPAVKEIKNYAFAKNEELKKITIADDVGEVSLSAFSEVPIEEATAPMHKVGGLNRNTLRKVTITSVGKDITNKMYGLADCVALEEVVFAEGVDTYQEYSSYASHGSTFKNCASLRKIEIPAGTREIASSDFSGCTHLREIIIPDSVNKIKSKAFEGCTGLYKVTIGSGVSEISKDAFNDCGKVLEVVNKSSYNLENLNQTLSGIEVNYLTDWAMVYGSEPVTSNFIEKDGFVFYKNQDKGHTGLLSYMNEIDYILVASNNYNIAALKLPGKIDGKKYLIWEHAIDYSFEKASLFINQIPIVIELSKDAVYGLEYSSISMKTYFDKEFVEGIGVIEKHQIQPITIKFDGTKTEFEAIESVTEEVAGQWFKGYGADLKKVQCIVECTDGKIEYDGLGVNKEIFS